MSLLVKRDKGIWRNDVLKNNTLVAACQLPSELFQPFCFGDTAFVVIEKGGAHNPKRKAMFVRLHHDGLALRKGTRGCSRPAEPNT